MILDTLAHADSYSSLHPLFGKVFDYLRTVKGTEEPGRYDIEGERAFALVQTYATKPVEKALFEAHRKYIDVQFIHSGRETILWAPLSAMKEQTMAYDEAKEAALWKQVPEATELHLSEDHFAILYPQDAHAPCVEWGASEQVFKVVVKVSVE